MKAVGFGQTRIENYETIWNLKAVEHQEVEWGLSYSKWTAVVGFSEHYNEDSDRHCGLVVRVLGYRSWGSGSIPGTTRKKK
jgi:hypothetical protein